MHSQCQIHRGVPLKPPMDVVQLALDTFCIVRRPGDMPLSVHTICVGVHERCLPYWFLEIYTHNNILKV